MTTQRVLWSLLVATMSLAIAVATALGAWQFVVKTASTASAADNAGLRAEVTKAASDGAVKVLTYSPETIEGDLAEAKTFLTGDFLAYYTDFTNQVVVPAVKQKAVKTSTVIAGAAVDRVSFESASVLIFANQTTTSAERPEPSVAASSVLVSMTKVGDRWLINKFEPT